MGLYEEWQARLGPPWAQRTNSEKIERALGAEKDEQQDRGRQAVLANLPGQAPVDALVEIGRERQLPRVTGETDAAYAERLRTTWDGVEGWSYAGSHGALLRALVRAGFPQGTTSGAHVIQRTRRYTYLTGYTPGGAAGTVTYATHNGWTFDSSPASTWNQFGILFGADVSGLGTDGFSAQRLNDLVMLWKPAKARFMGTWVVVAGPTWGWPLAATWGAGGRNWGVGTTRFIPPP